MGAYPTKVHWQVLGLKFGPVSMEYWADFSFELSALAHSARAVCGRERFDGEVAGEEAVTAVSLREAGATRDGDGVIDSWYV